MSTGLATTRAGNGEITETEIVRQAPVTPPSALAPIIRAEMDAAIVLAKQYPRSLTRFLDGAMTLATLSRSSAAQCCYSLPRGGKTVEGPSVRLAEIVASQYGNMRVDARIIEETQRFVVAQAVAQDLETNNTWRSEVRRSIWGNAGRYNDDMINTTCNAAISIASRNVIFRVVPRAIYWDIYLACKDIVKKGEKGKTVVDQRNDWLAFTREGGFKDGEVFAALAIHGADDMGLEQFAQLSGFQTAVQTGEATWEDIFRPRAAEAAESAAAPQPSKSERLVETLSKKNGGKGAAKPEPTPDKGEGWELGGGRE